MSVAAQDALHLVSAAPRGGVNPLADVSLLPGALATAGAEQAAISRLKSAGVRVAVIDRRTYSGYGHSSFGTTFDAALDRWIRSNFVRVAALTGATPESPTLELWLRRV